MASDERLGEGCGNIASASPGADDRASNPATVTTLRGEKVFEGSPVAGNGLGRPKEDRGVSAPCPICSAGDPFRHDRRIRRRHRQIRDFIPRHPSQRRMLVRLRLGVGFRETRHKRDQLHRHILVSMRHRSQLRHSHDRAAQLLRNFTNHRLTGRFSGLDLASGKFPQAGEMLSRRPLSQQQPPGIVLDQSTRHSNHRGCIHANDSTNVGFTDKARPARTSRVW